MLFKYVKVIKEHFDMPEKSLLLKKGKNNLPLFITKQWFPESDFNSKKGTSFCTVQTAECGFAICCRGQIIDGFKKDETGH